METNFEKFVENLLSNPKVNKEDTLYKLSWIMDHIKKYSPAYAKLREEEQQAQAVAPSEDVPSWF